MACALDAAQMDDSNDDTVEDETSLLQTFTVVHRKRGKKLKSTTTAQDQKEATPLKGAQPWVDLAVGGEEESDEISMRQRMTCQDK